MTITKNSGSESAGIQVNGVSQLLKMKNTIVADNTGGPDCGGTGIITSNDHNLDSDSSCILTGANDISSGNADLGLLADNGGPTKTHALGSNSDARQAGNTTLTTDQRGFARPDPAGTVPDIGAFEAGLPNTPPVADPQTVDTTQDTPVPITLTGSDADTADSISFKVTRLPNSGDLDDGTPLAAPRGISGDTVTYTPNAGVTGTDSFEFVANDATVDSAPATVTVNINPPPPGPAPLPRMPSLQQQLDILSGDNVPPELAHSAINMLPGMLLGTPVVLPTSGGAAGAVTMETWMETIRFFNRVDKDFRDAIDSLRDVKLGTAALPPHPDPGVRAHANEVSTLLEAALSVVNGLAGQVKGVDPTTAIPPHLRTDRQTIEGPFLPLAPGGFGHFPVERVEVCNVESGESSGGGTSTGGSFSEFSSNSSSCIIMKETFGVKAVLFHRIIPIFQEPWDVRESPIIGHEVVWYIRWLPAEHIKNIIYTQDPFTGQVKIRVRQFDILMPGLSKFWSFFPPDIPGVVVQAPPAP